MIVPRKRALFGLLDADGWAWARSRPSSGSSIIILMLGYIPDRAYYLTVDRTVDLGSSPGRRSTSARRQRDAAVPGAGRAPLVPWQASPAELACPRRGPTARRSRSGPRSCTSAARTGRPPSRPSTSPRPPATGNFDMWAEGPPLPEPRADASVRPSPARSTSSAGSTPTARRRPPSSSSPPIRRPACSASGTTAEDLVAARGPRRRSRRRGTRRPAAHRRRRPRRPGHDDLEEHRSTQQGALQAWAEEAPLGAPQADATRRDHRRLRLAVRRPRRQRPGRRTVQRGDLGLEAAEGFPENPDQGKVIGWEVNDGANLPAARDDAAGWTANGALYLAGGIDADDGPQQRALLGGPDDGRRHHRVEAPRGQRPADGAVPGRARSSTGPNVDPRRRRRTAERHRRTRASGPTPPRRARSSSSAWSARPCPGSRSTARSASSSAT